MKFSNEQGCDRIKRNIRLKEWGVLINEYKRATPSYIESTDASVEPGEYHLRTDIRGFIKTGEELERQGLFKIALLGDSFVESLFVPEQLRFAAIAEKAEPGGESIQVWNGGYSGANTLHILNIVTNKILPLKHVIRRLVIFTTINDCYPVTDYDGFWTSNKKATPFVGEGLTEKPRQQCAPDFEQYRALIKSIVVICNVWNINLVFVRVPYRTDEYSKDKFLQRSFASELQYSEQVNLMDALADVCEEESKLLEVPFWNGFDAFSEERNSRYFYDFAHLNVDGQALFGEWLKARIEG